MGRRFDRRTLLKRAALGAAGWWVLGGSRSAWSYQANEKLNLAVVGVGRRGTGLAGELLRLGQNLVAMCDVDRRRADPWRDKLPGVPWYQDFRAMLEEMGERLDAVAAALPCHNHAPVAAAAMRRGKHVYIEKPAAHNVAEARALRRIAGEQKVATQMGNQGVATDSFRRTVERVWEGDLGEVREAHVWFVFGGPGPRQFPTDSQPVPDHLNWAVWLGPAPLRPYHSAWMSGAWREFGTGALGGCGSHAIHMAFKGLRLGELWEESDEAPATIRVEAEPAEWITESLPRWAAVRYDIPARGALPPARIHWYNAPEGELRRQGIWERMEKIAGRSLIWEGSWTPESGTLLVGSRGVVHTNAHNSICAMLPAENFPEPAGKPKTMPSVRGHTPEWLEACRGGPTPLSHFGHSGPAMELLLLGNVATMFPGVLEYDPRAGKITNHAEADKALARKCREGWTL
jgi:hypothetical protein